MSADKRKSEEENMKRKRRAKDKKERSTRLSVNNFSSNYDKSGEIVKDNKGELLVADDGHCKNKIPRHKIIEVIQTVTSELKLPYTLQDFQLESLVALANGHNVILVSPTGSGKLVIIYIGIRMIEILQGMQLVALGSEPTQHIIKEKMTDPLLCSGSVSMKGQVEVNEGKLDISPGKAAIIAGRVKVVYGYQESWSHPEGKEIIEKLTESSQIGFLFFDEAHQNLAKFWGEWRTEMMMGPNEMRVQANRPPVILMSASMTPTDIVQLRRQFGIKNNTVIITRSPIISNIKYITLERPPNSRGFDGLEEEDEDEEEQRDKTNQVKWRGMLHPLSDIYIEQFCHDVIAGTEPKTAMIFSNNKSDLVNIQNYLYDRLGDMGSRKPWTLITAKTGEVTKLQMRQNSVKGEIRLYLCTSVLLMGVDIPRVDIVILCRPMASLHSLIQAAGRGGRKMIDGQRRLVVCYQLWNQEDIVIGRLGMEEETKTFCETFDCLGQYLSNYFCVEHLSSTINNWCCGNCDHIE